MSKLFIVILGIFFSLAYFACGTGPSGPVKQVGQYLIISNASAAGSGAMINTYQSSAVTNFFTFGTTAPVTSDMSVYSGSTGQFAVSFTGTFNYSFGSVTATGATANPTFLSSVQTFN
jgi:hypothetical protein